MCTAVSYKGKDVYFGRNLDLECGYGEEVVITPRSYEFSMRCVENLKEHFGMIGMATVADGYPLYYEATNEKGLSIAGLRFSKNAVYKELEETKNNIAPFELIPWILGQCESVWEAKKLLEKTNLVNVNFSEQLPCSPLHWMISDRKCSIVVESVEEGMKVYDNPFEVLTNNPPFAYHCMNMNHYMGLTTGPLKNQFKNCTFLENYSLGMGALGLPGDYSSASRFVKAFFVKENSEAGEDESSNVNQFFHILNSVAMPKGCVWTENGLEYTRYSSCCNVEQGVYYYTTYNYLGITSINMYDVDLDENVLYRYDVEGL